MLTLFNIMSLIADIQYLNTQFVSISSIQEKRAIVSLSSTAFAFAAYTWYLLNAYQEHNASTDFRFWAIAILLLVPITVIIKIIIHIIFVFINRSVTKENEILLIDELDKIIELKATKYSHWIFILGFFLSIIPLALSMQPAFSFFLLIISAFISGMTRDIAQIYFYRKGVTA